MRAIPGTLDYDFALLCPYPAQMERLPADVSEASLVFPNAHFAPDAKRATDGIVIGAVVSGYKQDVIGVTKAVQDASRIGDCLRAVGDDSRPIEEGVEPATTSGLEDDHQSCGRAGR
jgi:hypothetical protein